MNSKTYASGGETDEGIVGGCRCFYVSYLTACPSLYLFMEITCINAVFLSSDS